MNNVIVKKSFDEQGYITRLQLGGMLVLENSEFIKNEIVALKDKFLGKVDIEVIEVQDIDLSGIQLILALIQFLDDHHILYKFEWNLTEELQTLLENVGFSVELFLN